MSGATAPATKQGYLPEQDRPACRNCLMVNLDEVPYPTCMHGGFEIRADGWCTQWFAREDWIRAHRGVAAKMGVFLDKGPQSALEAAA